MSIAGVRFPGSILWTDFASNLKNLMDGDRAVLWIHGHMHESFDYEIYGTQVICNPRGYAPKTLNPDFRPEWLIELRVRCEARQDGRVAVIAGAK